MRPGEDHEKQKRQNRACEITLYISSGMFFLMGCVEPPLFIFAVLILLLGIHFGRSRKKAAALELLGDQYLPIVADRREWNLDRVAEAMGLPFEKVKKDVFALISSGNITGVYYNPAERRLVSYREHGQSAWQELS